MPMHTYALLRFVNFVGQAAQRFQLSATASYILLLAYVFEYTHENLSYCMLFILNNIVDVCSFTQVG